MHSLIPWLRLSARPISVLIKQRAAGCSRIMSLLAFLGGGHEETASSRREIFPGSGQHQAHCHHEQDCPGDNRGRERQSGMTAKVLLDLFNPAQFRCVSQGPIVEKSAQIVGELFGLLVSLVGIKRQALPHNTLERPWCVCPVLAHRRRGVAPLLCKCFDLVGQNRVPVL